MLLDKIHIKVKTHWNLHHLVFPHLTQIDYNWVKDLLPRLHELDAYGLSGCLKPDEKIKEEDDIDDREEKKPTAPLTKEKQGITTICVGL